eukprot:3751118-Rhodomonas_salina.1
MISGSTSPTRIVHYYKRRGFPKGFLQALKKFKCKVCTVCKGSHVYKHINQVQEQIKGQKKAKASCNIVKVLLESDLTYLGEEDDDLLSAFTSEELHMDYAHLIWLRYFQERYYLLFIISGRNFMWETPMTTRMEPEELLQDFLSVTALNIGPIQTDNEFTASTGFKAFCAKRSITLCQSVAYNHTMQARAEGAVRICKEHVQCLLKASKAPASFHTDALLPVVQLVARSCITTALGIHGQGSAGLQHGQRPPSLG